MSPFFATLGCIIGFHNQNHKVRTYFYPAFSCDVAHKHTYILSKICCFHSMTQYCHSGSGRKTYNFSVPYFTTWRALQVGSPPPWNGMELLGLTASLLAGGQLVKPENP